MKTEILMPSLSPTMEEGSLAKWYVSPGDKVKPGDIIADIETDKALMEYESIEEGTIVELIVKEGTENIKVNSLIAIIETEGVEEINIRKVDDNKYIVMGTPADCVHIGSLGILRKFPDIVFSGVNFGSNMGDDVIYSGTVGAAIEGRHARYGAFAISITSKSPKFLTDINSIVDYIVEYVFRNLKPYRTILDNIVFR